jgi:aerobic carbon-monoxide dehydrogenase medium subunit
MPASFDWVFAAAAYDCSLFDSKAGMTGESQAVALNDVSVLVPSSADEAVAAFADGNDVTVVAGATIVMPELAAGRLRPKSALLLGRAGLSGIARANGKVTIGAATPVSALVDADAPLAQAAKHIGDIEVRSQATVGGNICAISSDDTPRGDLQAALLALGGTVRSAGKGGERSDALDDFFADGAGRLVLDVSYDDVPRQAGYAAVWRPHTHHYTILAVCATRTADAVRVGITGAGPRGMRAPSVEQAFQDGGGAADAAQRVLEDVEHALRDDALASMWYRSRLLPRLVARVLTDLQEDG